MLGKAYCPLDFSPVQKGLCLYRYRVTSCCVFPNRSLRYKASHAVARQNDVCVQCVSLGPLPIDCDRWQGLHFRKWVLAQIDWAQPHYGES